MSTTTERKPLLSDEEINGADGVMTPGPDSVYKLERKRYLFRLTPEDVRDFYEGLLDRGDLVIPKTARWMCDLDDSTNDPFRIYGVKCTNCGATFDDGLLDPVKEKWSYCPRCNARIIE